MQNSSRFVNLFVAIALLVSNGLAVHALAQQQDSSQVKQIAGSAPRSFRWYVVPLGLIAEGKFLFCIFRQRLIHCLQTMAE